MKPDLVDALVEKGYRGIVIAGTGLGHVNKPLYPALERAVRAGVHVVMTVQTLWGYAQMYVYDTGRDLLDLGVVPLDNMLPETALMKLSWVLGQTDEHAEVMRLMRHPYRRRDHRARAPQRLPDPAGRPAGDGRVRQVPLEVGGDREDLMADTRFLAGAVVVAFAAAGASSRSSRPASRGPVGGERASSPVPSRWPCCPRSSPRPTRRGSSSASSPG